MARGKKVMKLRALAKKSTIKYETGVPAPVVKGKYYNADDVVKSKGPTPVRNAPKVRANLVPGTVLLLLAGRFRGKRVVCLKALTSGLILVSGPYHTNGVPLRRVNQKYVIATSTSVSVTGVDVSKIDDAFFAREKKVVKKGEDALFDNTKKPTETSEARKLAQGAVDAALNKNIAKTPMLSAYLKARFTLSNSDKPHAMVF
jgi:large subunit ribosomal protein L6e